MPGQQRHRRGEDTFALPELGVQHDDERHAVGVLSEDLLVQCRGVLPPTSPEAVW